MLCVRVCVCACVSVCVLVQMRKLQLASSSHTLVNRYFLDLCVISSNKRWLSFVKYYIRNTNILIPIPIFFRQSQICAWCWRLIGFYYKLYFTFAIVRAFHQKNTMFVHHLFQFVTHSVYGLILICNYMDAFDVSCLPFSFSFTGYLSLPDLNTLIMFIKIGEETNLMISPNILVRWVAAEKLFSIFKFPTLLKYLMDGVIHKITIKENI